MPKPVQLSSWHIVGVVIFLVVWSAGDFLLLTMVDTAVLDCLGVEGRSRRTNVFETLVCHPLLLGEGPAGWLLVAWFWVPIVVLVWWLRGRR